MKCRSSQLVYWCNLCD